QVRGQVIVGERVGVDRLQCAVSPDRGRLDRLVPVAELLAPELPLEDFFRAAEALRNIGLGGRPHGLVREAVHVLELQTVQQQSVGATELLRPAEQGFGMGFDPVPRRRTRKVNGVEFPESGTRWNEAKFGRLGSVDDRHWSPLSAADYPTRPKNLASEIP